MSSRLAQLGGAVDIREPLLEILDRLGIEEDNSERWVSELHIHPLRIRLVYYLKDEDGQTVSEDINSPDPRMSSHAFDEYKIAWLENDPARKFAEPLKRK
jgi:hypothetical protein